MLKEGDDDDEQSQAVAKYPCMPSLMALQQMRNRLHMAHLGKKLMKWSALATGRELRKLALELNESHKNFDIEMRKAFILLARGRYFSADLNRCVLENVPFEASVKVDTTYKCVSGVKVYQMEIIELPDVPYMHLGLNKGGQTIEEAKEVWRGLLKRVILMLEQRNNYTRIETAHKNATNKRNALTKMVLPKLTATIKYITTELEEAEREESYRLKLYQKSKNKNKEPPVKICCCCLKMFEADTQAESVCPICSKAAKMRKKSSCKIQIAPCKSAEIKSDQNKKRLEHLMAHIDEVIGLTKKYKMEGIISPSIEKFIKTCSEVKLRIEDLSCAPPSCDICQKALENSASKITLIPKSSFNFGSTCTIQRPPETCNAMSKPCNFTTETKNDDNLGYFETEYKEIVKVRRLQNEDGSVSEEKQVITVKTEKKYPNRMSALENGNNEMFEISKIGDTVCDSRKSKSMHARSSDRFEPKVRRCMSSDNYGTQTNTKCISGKTSKVTLPPESQTSCASTKSNTSNSCIKKPAVCGSTSNMSNESCCKIIKKAAEPKNSCTSVCRDKPDNQNKFKKQASADALWRDQWTSMTDFETIPSKVMTNSRCSPKTSRTNTNCTTIDDDEEEEMQSDSCCLIKIITKPNKPKGCPKADHQDVVIKGGMLEALKKIILPNTYSNCGLQRPEPMNPVNMTPRSSEQNICKSCSEKMHSQSSKSSKMCHTESLDLSCTSYSTPKSSCTSVSSKSLGVCSLNSMNTAQNSCCTSHASKKSSDKKVDCKICTADSKTTSNSCCHSKSSKKSSEKKVDCKICNESPKSSKSIICCSNTKSTSTCCPIKSEESLKCCTKDASTCTRRSTRFDVRPLKKRRPSVKANLECTCFSDSYMLKNRMKNDARRTKSFCEDEYYYFRW